MKSRGDLADATPAMLFQTSGVSSHAFASGTRTRHLPLSSPLPASTAAAKSELWPLPFNYLPPEEEYKGYQALEAARRINFPRPGF